MSVTNAELDTATQWPDFYAILDAKPESDPATLRRSINELYQQANQNYDHREISRRFYFQVLSQKVLPQCRRILLDPSTRAAYDKQWHLHHEASDTALSYPDFVKHLLQTHPDVDAKQLFLTSEEIQILPALKNSASAPVAAPPAVTDAIPTLSDNAPPVATIVKPLAQANAISPATLAPTAAKKPPLLIAGALGLLALGLGAALLRPSNPTASAPAPHVEKPKKVPALASLPLEEQPEIIPSGRGGQAPVWKYTTTRPGGFWASPSFDATAWKSGPAGFGQGELGAAVIRTKWNQPGIWARREVVFPANLPAKLAFVTRHDEDVTIYINGVLANKTKGHSRRYVDLKMSPAGRDAIRAGKNLLAAHCSQTGGSQYLDIGIVAAR